jgi:hypothetical protein
MQAVRYFTCYMYKTSHENWEVFLFENIFSIPEAIKNLLGMKINGCFNFYWFAMIF